MQNYEQFLRKTEKPWENLCLKYYGNFVKVKKLTETTDHKLSVINCNCLSLFNKLYQLNITIQLRRLQHLPLL